MLSTRPGAGGAARGTAGPSVRRHGRRGARAAVVATAVVAWVVGPAAARSNTDFGTLGLNRLGYGSRVSIRTPAAALFQEADEFVLERDVVQSRNKDPGLIQAGIYRSGSGLQLDNCGTQAGYVLYTEVKQVNSMAYRCQVYSRISPGATATFNIFRYSTSASWGIRINGVTVGTPSRLGFNRGDPAIGTEIQDIDSNHGTHTSTRFVPPGHAQWRVYTTRGRSHTHRVSGGDQFSLYRPSDPFWRIGRPPHAVTITHRP